MTGIPLPGLPDHAAPLVHELAERLRSQVDDYVAELTALIELEVADLKHEAASGPWLLAASIRENTIQLVENLGYRVDPRTVDAPPGATGYARQLARSEVPMAALLRAYRFGQARFTQRCLRTLDELDPHHPPEVVRFVVDQVAVFIDHICEIVAVVYEEERDRWIGSRSGLRQHWVTALLAERSNAADVAAAEKGLHHPLSAHHRAIEIWSPDTTTPDDGSSPVDAVAVALGGLPGQVCRPLVVPVGHLAVRVWMAQDGPRQATDQQLLDLVGASGPVVHLAVGQSLPGLHGFRRSHAQARRTQALVRRRLQAARTPAVVRWDDVATASLVLDQPLDAADLVSRHLGGLAAGDERSRGLRDTLQAFLQCAQSYPDTAERLIVHRNTVRYRIEQAEAVRGRPVAGHEIADTLLALQILHWAPDAGGPQPAP